MKKNSSLLIAAALAVGVSGTVNASEVNIQVVDVLATQNAPVTAVDGASAQTGFVSEVLEALFPSAPKPTARSRTKKK